MPSEWHNFCLNYHGTKTLMKKHLNHSLFLIILLICTAFGPCSSVPNNTTPTKNSEGGSQVIPTTSVPVQSAKVDTTKIIHYAPDSGSYSPVIGSAGAVVPENNATLKILFMPNASSVDSNSTNVLPPGNNLCSVNTCCDINTDGSFECYPESGLNTELNSYLTDGTTLYSLIEEKQKPNASLLWLKDIPQNLAVGPKNYRWNELIESSNVIWAVTDNIGSAVLDNNGLFTVTGNHHNKYKAFDALDISELIYDPLQNKLGGLIPNSGLPISTFDNSLGLLDPSAFNLFGLTEVPETILYNKIKYTDDGFMRFIRKPDNATSTEYIYNALDSTVNNIRFFDNDLSTISQITNTIAFDVESSGWGLVLFEENNNLRFRMATNYSSYRYGGKNILNIQCNYNEAGLCNYSDLLIYQNNADNNANGKFTDSIDKGRALLLDNNNRAGIISYDNQNEGDAKIDGWISLGENKNPIALVLNSRKDTAYILNQGDNTITVLTLKNNGIALSLARIGLAEINLVDYLEGRNNRITPTSLVYHHNNAEGEYLLVGSESLKGAIVIDVKKLND